MSNYSHAAIAGGNPAHYFNHTLRELADFVKIDPPTFRGKLLYQEHGLAKWEIKTVIPKRDEDPSDVRMEYSEEYPDWDFSIDMAMQGAIARICHKYHDLIPRTSAYFQFGERTEDGRPFDRTGTDKWSIIHQYMVEREYSTVGMEDVLRGQMDGIEKLMDKYDARDKVAVEAQAKIVDLELENVVIQERMSLLEEPLKMEERLICSDVWAEALKKTLLLTIENRTEEAKKREILMSKMEALKMENQALKGTITQLLDERVVEKAPKRKTRQMTKQYLKRFKPVPEA